MEYLCYKGSFLCHFLLHCKENVHSNIRTHIPHIYIDIHSVIYPQREKCWITQDWVWISYHTLYFICVRPIIRIIFYMLACNACVYVCMAVNTVCWYSFSKKTKKKDIVLSINWEVCAHALEIPTHY